MVDGDLWSAEGISDYILRPLFIYYLKIVLLKLESPPNYFKIGLFEVH